MLPPRPGTFPSHQVSHDILYFAFKIKSQKIAGAKASAQLPKYADVKMFVTTLASA